MKRRVLMALVAVILGVVGAAASATAGFAHDGTWTPDTTSTK